MLVHRRVTHQFLIGRYPFIHLGVVFFHEATTPRTLELYVKKKRPVADFISQLTLDSFSVYSVDVKYP